MKFLYLLLFPVIMIASDALDFLDEIDSDVSVFEEDKSVVNLRAKLSFQKNDKTDDTKIFYISTREQTQNYFYDIRFIADEDIQNLSIKELYYKGSFSEASFYELGRINVKEGVARGYNPTDYFKGTTSLTLSNDPKERKDNRLGSLLWSQTFFLDKYTIKGIYSPSISVSKNNFLSDTKYIGLHLDETNYHDRASLYVDYSGFKDVSSSVIFHLNEDDVNFGLNLSYISGSWIWYLENSLKYAKDDITKIIEKMQASPLIQDSFVQKKSYVDQVAVGVNYTSASNIVTTVEYIFNSKGLDSSGWDDWFSLGKKHPQLNRELGAISEQSSNNESLLSRESLFIFSRASDIQTNLDASVLLWINPYDSSNLSQVGMQYSYNDDIQTNIYLRSYQGSKDTQYGSSLNNYEILIEGEYFF